MRHSIRRKVCVAEILKRVLSRSANDPRQTIPLALSCQRSSRTPFEVTKGFHKWLYGEILTFKVIVKQLPASTTISKRTAELLNMDFDVYAIHDPQRRYGDRIPGFNPRRYYRYYGGERRPLEVSGAVREQVATNISLTDGAVRTHSSMTSRSYASPTIDR